MFDQKNAPLRVLDQPLLGDAVLSMSEPTTNVPFVAMPISTDVPVWDPRLSTLQQQVDLLTMRVYMLEQQTWLARWHRFTLWCRHLWLRIRRG